MEPLPVETWTQIIHMHLQEQDWLSLSITSHFLRQIAQSALFHEIRFAERTDVNPLDHRVILFKDSLTRRPELATLVHVLHILYRDKADGIVRHISQHPLLRALDLFPNLQTLHVTGFHIDPHFCSTLQSHAQLTEISFDTCRMAVTLPDVPVDVSSGSKRWAAESAHESATGRRSGMRSLTIKGARPEYVGDIMPRVGLLGGTLELTTLSIEFTTSLAVNIVSFLTSINQLRCLSMIYRSSEPTGVAVLHSLPTSAMPLLEVFKGPAEFATIIVPGRPVHTVTLDFIKVLVAVPDSKILLPLRFSTVPLRNLIFEHAPGTNIGPFLEHAPNSIHYLRCRIVHKVTALTWPTTLSRMQSLRVFALCLISAGYIQNDRADVVQQFSEACPSIREFCFQDERWLARRGGGWERYFST